MLQIERKLKVTSDGSNTIELVGKDEHYHSTHGALQESMHVFIKMGLSYLIDKGVNDIRILEVGLGSGLNCMCTLDVVSRTQINLSYHGIEAFPLEENILRKINFREYFQKDLYDLFLNCMLDDWHIDRWIHPRMLIHFQQVLLENANLESDAYNLVYYDAFGPRTQPEMWTWDIFSKIYHAMSSNAILVTYCAKGEVKRCLKQIGFAVESLPGPPGKREMIRAVKT